MMEKIEVDPAVVNEIAQRVTLALNSDVGCGLDQLAALSLVCAGLSVAASDMARTGPVGAVRALEMVAVSALGQLATISPATLHVALESPLFGAVAAEFAGKLADPS
jgi:hypothetical protein